MEFIQFEKIIFQRAFSCIKWYSGEYHLAFPTDHFVDWTFRVSNWNPTKQLAFDREAVRKKQANFNWKAMMFFFNTWFENSFILRKSLALKEPLADVMLHYQGTAQTVRRPCEPIVLSIRNFERPAEVQLKSC